MSGVAPCGRVVRWLAHSTRYRDLLRPRANCCALPRRAHAGVPLRGGRARLLLLGAHSGSPPTRARGHGQPADCRDRRHDSAARHGSPRSWLAQHRAAIAEGRLAIGLEMLGSSSSGGKLGRLERRNEGARYGLVDLNTTDVETVAATPLDKMLAAAMVPGSRVSAAIVSAQTTAAMAAAGETLQECAAFSHGATYRTRIIMRPRPRVGGDACLVGFIGRPVDVTLVMFADDYLPLLAR